MATRVYTRSRLSNEIHQTRSGQHYNPTVTITRPNDNPTSTLRIQSHPEHKRRNEDQHAPLKKPKEDGYEDDDLADIETTSDLPEGFASIASNSHLKQLFVHITQTIQNIDGCNQDEDLIWYGDQFFRDFYRIDLANAERKCLNVCLRNIAPAMEEENVYNNMLKYMEIFMHELTGTEWRIQEHEILRICVVRSGIEVFMNCIEFEPDLEKYSEWKFDVEIYELDSHLIRWRIVLEKVNSTQIPNNIPKSHFWWRSEN